MLIAGDSNAGPAVVPCLAKGISAGRFVDSTIFSWGWYCTCGFSLEGGAGSRRDSIVGCPNALTAPDACFLDG